MKCMTAIAAQSPGGGKKMEENKSIFYQTPNYVTTLKGRQ